jgi:DNA-binding NtrC family response regulator
MKSKGVLLVVGSETSKEMEANMLAGGLRESGFDIQQGPEGRGLVEAVFSLQPAVLLMDSSACGGGDELKSVILAAKEKAPSLCVFIALRPDDFSHASIFSEIDFVDFLVRPLNVGEERSRKRIEDHSNIRRVLVVDDDAGALKHYGKFLSKRGYDVSTSGSALGALQDLAAAVGKIHAVLLDIDMPGSMDGIAVLERIRKGDNYRKPDDETAVIMVSGMRREEVVKSAANLGISGFCAKPVDLAGKLLPELRLACFKRKLLSIDRTYCTGRIVDPTAKNKDISDMCAKIAACLSSK